MVELPGPGRSSAKIAFATMLNESGLNPIILPATVSDVVTTAFYGDKQVTPFDYLEEEQGGGHWTDFWGVFDTEISIGLIAFIKILIICVIVVGNLLVILSIFTHKPLRQVQNLFVVSLASSDVTVGLFVTPFNVIYHLDGKNWMFGIISCKLWLTFDVLCCTSSILNLCAIAIDRHCAINDPLEYVHKRTMGRVLRHIAIVWLISLAVSVPPLVGWNDWHEKDFPGKCELSSEKYYVLFSALSSFYSPLALMCIMYVKIFLSQRKRLRQRAEAAARIPLPSLQPGAATQPNGEEAAGGPSAGGDSDSGAGPSCSTGSRGGNVAAIDVPDPQPISRCGAALNVNANFDERQRICLAKERRAARTLGIVVGVFVVCWLPFFLMYVTLPFCTICSIPDMWMNFFVWLGYFNSALNPFIYTYYNQEYRKAFKNILTFNICWDNFTAPFS